MMAMRRQVLLGLLGVTLVCTLLAGVATYWKLLEEANELFDYELRTLAVAVPTRGTAVTAAALRGDPEEAVVVQVWAGDGRLVYASTAAPLPAAPGSGYGTIAAQGERWRVYVALRGADRVQVAQAVSGRKALAVGVALRSLAPFLAMMPILAALMYAVVGRGLAPFRRLAAAVAQRSPDALQPLASGGQPPELAPVVAALNALLARLDAALTSQRAFVADAAHELRSPLTALKLQLQLAERAGADAPRRAAFAKLHERLERAIHLVQQLLVAARQESPTPDRAIGRVDLLDLAQACIADRYVAACAKRIDVGMPEHALPVMVTGRADDLAILLGNLIDNALRYTPPDGQVDVVVGNLTDRAFMQVTDNGPGIAPSERTRVFNRFYRGEAHAEWGSGLGLSIVAAIAMAHGATVRLDDNPEGCGLRVTVYFTKEETACSVP